MTPNEREHHSREAVPAEVGTEVGGHRVAVVAAGAGARGAFEAGALSVLIEWLDERGLRPNMYVGTSAGAINATLLAATAGWPASESAAQLLEFWRGLRVREVFRSPVRTALTTVPTYIGQLLGIAHVVSLLDTTPLVGFAQRTFAQFGEELNDNVIRGTVQALAVAATDVSERTVVFTDLAPGMTVPPANLGRAIEYRPTRISFRHVLASSAIPILFRPVEIDGAYYTDGGVRLNVPLAPAVALGATHAVVVATHPETPPAAPAVRQKAPPDVVDSVAGILGSLLADRMVEDIHTLDLVNANAAGTPARLIPRLFVGPKTRRELGELAARLYVERHKGRRAIRELDFRLAHMLLGRAEKGDGDILSYILFDEAFIDEAIQLGIRYARNIVGSGAPWLPALPSGASALTPRKPQSGKG